MKKSKFTEAQIAFILKQSAKDSGTFGIQLIWVARGLEMSTTATRLGNAA